MNSLCGWRTKTQRKGTAHRPLILKKMAARAREALIEAIGRALEAVRKQDALGWFAHCG